MPWYVSVLVDLAYVQGPVHGPLVAAQLIDVAVRAEAVRGYAVRCMLGLLLDASGLFLGQSQATMAHVLYAAGWIVGEYATHLPAQAGAEDGEPDASLGQSQQSVVPMGWPATPAAVFVRVMEAYLDPRAAELPEEVQVVYIQNALKALAAAVALLGEDGDLASLLAALRGDRLLVFLQSVHIEVQERAATLRNLLVALGVLPALAAAVAAPVVAVTGRAGSDGGEESEGDDHSHGKAPAAAAAAATADLLGGGVGDGVGTGADGGVDLMLLGDEAGAMGAATTGGSGGGDAGVRALRLHRGLLAALFAEQLAPVNPKAQRKVPVPAGLDLAAPLDGKALAELEGYTGGFPRDPDLSRVCFTHVFVEPAAAAAAEEPAYPEGISPLGTPGRLGGYEEAFGADSPQDAARRRTPFYLSSTAAGAGGEEGVGMGEGGAGVMFTAADLEGDRRGRRRGKDGKKERKKHRRRRGEEDEEEEDGGRYAGAGALGGASVLRDEVMPAGAVDSGSDGEGKGAGRGLGDEDAMDLKDIDITTPLRPDEVIPRMEHRAAPPTAVAAAAAPAAVAKGERERRKHRRKESSSGRRKGGGGGSSSKRSGAGGDAGGDLIDFGDFGGGAPAPVSSAGVRRDSADTRRLKADAMDLLMFGDTASSPPRATTAAADDVLGLGGAPPSPPKERRRRKDKEKEKDKSHRRKAASSAARATAPAPARLLDVMGAPAPAPAAAAAAAAADAAPLGSLRGLRFPLVKTGGVKVEYSLLPDPTNAGRVTVQLRAKNAAAPGPIAGVRLRLLPPFPPGVTPEETTAVLAKGPFAVGAAGKATVALRLEPEARGRSLALPVRLELGAAKEEADLLGSAGTGGTSKQAKLVLPASVSLRPGAMTPQGFMALLSGANREVAWHESSARLPRGRKSGGFDAAVAQIAAFFQAQTIEKTPPAAAALYATTATEVRLWREALVVGLGSHTLMLSFYFSTHTQTTGARGSPSQVQRRGAGRRGPAVGQGEQPGPGGRLGGGRAGAAVYIVAVAAGAECERVNDWDAVMD